MKDLVEGRLVIKGRLGTDFFRGEATDFVERRRRGTGNGFAGRDLTDSLDETGDAVLEFILITDGLRFTGSLNETDDVVIEELISVTDGLRLTGPPDKIDDAILEDSVRVTDGLRLSDVINGFLGNDSFDVTDSVCLNMSVSIAGAARFVETDDDILDGRPDNVPGLVFITFGSFLPFGSFLTFESFLPLDSFLTLGSLLSFGSFIRGESCNCSIDNGRLGCNTAFSEVRTEIRKNGGVVASHISFNSMLGKHLGKRHSEIFSHPNPTKTTTTKT